MVGLVFDWDLGSRFIGACFISMFSIIGVVSALVYLLQKPKKRLAYVEQKLIAWVLFGGLLFCSGFCSIMMFIPTCPGFLFVYLLGMHVYCGWMCTIAFYFWRLANLQEGHSTRYFHMVIWPISLICTFAPYSMGHMDNHHKDGLKLCGVAVLQDVWIVVPIYLYFAWNTTFICLAVHKLHWCRGGQFTNGKATELLKFTICFSVHVVFACLLAAGQSRASFVIVAMMCQFQPLAYVFLTQRKRIINMFKSLRRWWRGEERHRPRSRSRSSSFTPTIITLDDISAVEDTLPQLSMEEEEKTKGTDNSDSVDMATTINVSVTNESCITLSSGSFTNTDTGVISYVDSV